MVGTSMESRRAKRPKLLTLSALLLPAALWPDSGWGQTVWSSRQIVRNQEDMTSLAYNGRKFLATAENYDLYESKDGETWQFLESNWDDKVRYAGQLFFTFRTDLHYSTDGITWVYREIEGARIPRINDIAHNGSMYVAVGKDDITDSALLITSPDARQWTRRPLGLRHELFSIAWTGKRFIVVGESRTSFGDSSGNVTGSPGPILTSEDGITWTPRKTVMSQDVVKVIWSGKRAVAVGGDIMTSPDGITWKLETWRRGYPFETAVSNGDQVVAFSRDSLFLSVDGGRWIPKAMPSFTEITDALFTGEKFVATGRNGLIVTSTVDPALPVASPRQIRFLAVLPQLPGRFLQQGRSYDARGALLPRTHGTPR